MGFLQTIGSRARWYGACRHGNGLVELAASNTADDWALSFGTLHIVRSWPMGTLHPRVTVSGYRPLGPLGLAGSETDLEVYPTSAVQQRRLVSLWLRPPTRGPQEGRVCGSFTRRTDFQISAASGRTGLRALHSQDGLSGSHSLWNKTNLLDWGGGLLQRR